jgi:hypothetical protein
MHSALTEVHVLDTALQFPHFLSGILKEFARRLAIFSGGYYLCRQSHIQMIVH